MLSCQNFDSLLNLSSKLTITTRAVETELKFQDPAPKSRRFWLLLQNDLVDYTRKTMYYFYNSLAQEATCVEPEPNFRLRL